MENAGALLAVFSIIWAFVFAYVFLLISRQKRLKREIEMFKEKLKDNIVDS